MDTKTTIVDAMKAADNAGYFAVKPACNHECQHRGQTCGEREGSNGRYVCTRDLGHSGPHVACGFDHACSVWTKDDQKTKDL